jgi:NUMOD3 motif
MDYLKIYENIIINAIFKNRQKSKKNYYENHHIFPKCWCIGDLEYLKNDNRNLVLLTPREHFICHFLLTKIYDSVKMWLAYWNMCTANTKKNRKYIINSIYYEKARKKHIEFSSKLNSKKVIQIDKITKTPIRLWDSIKDAQETLNVHHISECCRSKQKSAGGFIWCYEGIEPTEYHICPKKTTKGKITSEETKEKISKSNLGRNLSEEHKRRISESNKGRIVTKETREKIKQANIGKTLSEETKEKISQASIIFANTTEYKEKARQRMIGNSYAKGNSFNHTEETKEKISKSNLGKKRTKESMENARQSNMKPVLKFTHTGKFIKYYESVTAAVKDNGIGERTLITCLKKTSGLRLGNGFIWAYRSDFTEEQYIRILKESMC